MRSAAAAAEPHPVRRSLSIAIECRVAILMGHYKSRSGLTPIIFYYPGEFDQQGDYYVEHSDDTTE